MEPGSLDKGGVCGPWPPCYHLGLLGCEFNHLAPRPPPSKGVLPAQAPVPHANLHGMPVETRFVFHNTVSPGPRTVLAGGLSENLSGLLNPWSFSQ